MPPSLEYVKASLPGVWSLVSFTIHGDETLSGEPVGHPYADNPLGKAIFTSSGYMSGTVAPGDVLKASYSSKSWFELSDEEILAVARPMSTYSGPYRIDQKDDGELWLTCDVEVALNPGWMNSPQYRRRVTIWEEEGSQFLLLSPTALTAEQPVFPKLVWKKVQEWSSRGSKI